MPIYLFGVIKSFPNLKNKINARAIEKIIYVTNNADSVLPFLKERLIVLKT